MRPAVNVGLSVSRVGGAAQTKAMKKAAGSIRIDLAQFREMQVFTQFSSDLDDSTKDMLKYGNGLMQLLKQPIGHPLSMAEQVVTLCAAMHKAFQDVPVDQVKSTQVKMLDYFNEKKPDIMNAVTIGQQLTPDLEKQITDSADEFVKMFLEEQSEKNKT
jgi:F-type H+-transporting ATPase subunit alpha